PARTRTLLLPAARPRRQARPLPVALARPGSWHVGCAGRMAGSPLPHRPLRYTWTRRIGRTSRRLLAGRSRRGRPATRRRARHRTVRVLRALARRDDRAVARGRRAPSPRPPPP